MVTLKIMPPAILVKRQFFKYLPLNCSQCGEKDSKLELRKHTLNHQWSKLFVFTSCRTTLTSKHEIMLHMALYCVTQSLPCLTKVTSHYLGASPGAIVDNNFRN